MKRFLTLFPLTSNIHLVKDVGMVPYILHKHFGYESTLACYKNGDYNYLDNEVKGLKIVFIKKIFNNQFLDSLVFLLFHSRKYDILQNYHLQKANAFILLFFKILTFGKGATYLKMDVDETILKLEFKGIFGRFYKFLVKKIDILSVETKFLTERLNSTNLLGRPVLYIPNGYYSNGNETAGLVDCTQKKKKILTVGRIGTFQKYNEVLLEAFAKFSEQVTDWSLELVGPVEDTFYTYTDDYFKRFPQLKGKVEFTGMITDKLILSAKYRESLIFALTSRTESFGLVYVEAISYGCYILSSNLTSAYDVTDNGKYGDLFEIGDSDALSVFLVDIAGNPEKLNSNCLEVQEYAKANFSWPSIMKRLHVQFSKISND